MTTPVRLSIVIPALNEAARIAQSLEALQNELPPEAAPWEILVVDDGSTDGTPGIVETIGRADPRIRLQRERHRGKGGAIRAGMLAATGEVRFMCDADLSMPVFEIRRFLADVPAHADVAVGSREGEGARRVGEPSHRHTMGRVFNGLVRALGLADINDTQCGFKMFSAAAVDAIFPWLTLDGWAFDIEVLALARLRGLRVKEIPIEWHYRALSRVSPVIDAMRMSWDVLKIRLNIARGIYRIPPDGR
jgi:glycosyltransferase involved in cell wall biosynthesis